MKHTEGRLRAELMGIWWVLKKEGVGGIFVDLTRYSEDRKVGEAIAHRLAAAWNAVEGIETEEIGNMKNIREVGFQIAVEKNNLKTQLDHSEQIKGELLATVIAVDRELGERETYSIDTAKINGIRCVLQDARNKAERRSA